MSIDSKDAHETLALMRTILEEQGSWQRSAGLVYAAAGGLYGIACLVGWLDAADLLPIDDGMHGLLAALSNALFILLLSVVIWRGRGGTLGAGAATRAVNAVFGGAGLATVAIGVIFAHAAMTREDFSVWLFHPVVVCALQGAVWYAAAVIRRRRWMGAVAAGWLISAVGAGMLVSALSHFLLVMTIALFGLMLVPGIIMMRTGREA